MGLADVIGRRWYDQGSPGGSKVGVITCEGYAKTSAKSGLAMSFSGNTEMKWRVARVQDMVGVPFLAGFTPPWEPNHAGHIQPPT